MLLLEAQFFLNSSNGRPIAIGRLDSVDASIAVISQALRGEEARSHQRRECECV